MINNKNYIKYINYLFVFLVINYNLLTRFIINTDSTRYGLIILSWFVLLFNNRSFNRILLKKPLLIWLVWCCFAFINYYIHPHEYNPLSVIVLYRMIFIPLIVMFVIVKEYLNNSLNVLWLCLITHVFYMIFGFYFDRGILFRNLDEENVLGNAYAIISSFTIFYLILLNRLKKLRTPIAILMIFLALTALSMSGTRKAFGAGIILIAFWAYSYLQLRKVKSVLLAIVFVVVGFTVYGFLLENTYMGERMDYLSEQGEQYLPAEAPAFLSIFGDRASHYYYGWKIFLNNPIIGVGTAQSHVPQGLGSLVYVHSEYIAQLSDFGIIGFILFMLFYYIILKNLFKKIKYDVKLGRCMLGGIIAIMFMNLTAWSWEFPQYFICLGVIIGYSFKEKYNISTFNVS